MGKSSTSCVTRKAAAGRRKRASAAQTRANLDAEYAEYLANKTDYDAAVVEMRSQPLQEQKKWKKYATQFNVRMWTLRRRFLGLSKDPHDAHDSQRFMSETQEDTLAEWIGQMGMEGRPVSERALRLKVKLLTGKLPHRTWVRRYRTRNPDMVFASTNGLDPKRAAAFQPEAVKTHFKTLKQLIHDYNIKVNNIYNMDEQGIQMGGGRKRTGRKYFFRRHDRQRYRKRAADLELVTVIDIVCADGTKLIPGIVHCGSNTYEMDWFKAHPELL
jgi:hypothetical protein